MVFYRTTTNMSRRFITTLSSAFSDTSEFAQEAIREEEALLGPVKDRQPVSVSIPAFHSSNTSPSEDSTNTMRRTELTTNKPEMPFDTCHFMALKLGLAKAQHQCACSIFYLAQDRTT